MNSISQSIAQRRQTRSVNIDPNAVLTIVMDDHSIHCMTESMIDVWWGSLTPQQKAEVYETNLDCFPAPLVVHELAEDVDRFVKSWAAINEEPIDVLGKSVLV